MAESPIASAWRDPEALAALSEQLARERVVQLSAFLAGPLPELPGPQSPQSQELPASSPSESPGGQGQAASRAASPPLSESLLPPTGHLEREQRPGFAVRATGPPLRAELWRSPALAEWLARATGARWELRDCRHERYGPGDYSLLHDSEGEGDPPHGDVILG